MLAVIVAALLAVAVGLGAYLGWERLGTRGLGMAALRAGALTVLALLLLNPASTERVSGGPPTVLLDASLSMGARGGHWPQAVDTALKLAASTSGVLRFGAAVTRFDSFPPAGGETRLGEALRVAAARSSPVVIVTDGGVDDAAVIPPALLDGARLVLLPRDTIPDAALMDVAVEARAQRGDSISATLLISTVGPLSQTTGRLEVTAGDRRLLATEIPLPPSPGIARRVFRLPARALESGTHILTFRLTVPGDGEPGDDVRRRVITVSEQPALVVLVNPADWEGRFLVSTLAEVAHTTVRGFARVRPDRWVDMRTLAPVADGDLRSAVRGAAVVVARGDVAPELAGWRGPVWRWPAGTESATQSIPGEWYVARETPASPVGGRLASAEWDSVPPLDDLVPVPLAPGDWVGLNARLGRRGSERPVLIGRDSAGVRVLITAAEGLHRWGLRGGAPREAYRAFIAGGVDWLLGAAAIQRTASLTSSDVVPRGMPVAFRWTRTPVPDSLPIRVTGRDTTLDVVLRFDAGGVARLDLPPGAYRWTAPSLAGLAGLAVVEEYSDEFRVRPVTLRANDTGDSFSLVERRPRERWWLFVLVVAAFVGEWAWRLSRGLP